MTSRWRLRHHPTAITQLDALYTSVLHGHAATTTYRPAAPAGPDEPATWATRPPWLAPFRCTCHGTPFHVRRHLEAHEAAHATETQVEAA